ncbi:hypothetical protein, partial [Helicobacter japonicus]|uniref:hypothetical protein n=1 Tax=Helicobacter japonicus TaxID=425400 RepID=UPI0025B54A64
MQENFTSPILDKHRVISIALLNQHINTDSLKALSLRLKQRFAYFEILLLNPILSLNTPNNKKYAKIIRKEISMDLDYLRKEINETDKVILSAF